MGIQRFFLAATLFIMPTLSFAQAEPPPTVEGNVVDGHSISMCVELADSTTDNPKYFSGGARLVNSMLSPQQKVNGINSLKSVFDTMKLYTSTDVSSGAPEMIEVISRQLNTIKDHYGTVYFGPNRQAVIDHCPSGAKPEDFALKS